MKTRLSWLAGIFAASVALSGAAGAFETANFGQAVVRLGPDAGRATMVAPEPGFSAKRRTSTFIVTFDAGFNANPAAKAAFQRAVNIWAATITSQVPIRVNARFANLGNTGILGSASPTTFARCPPGPCPAGAVANTWYPIALFNKLSRRDVFPQGLDINAQFNNTFNGFFFGTGQTPANKINFTSVVLHELGHGLGFIGFGTLVNGNTLGSVRLNQPPFPRFPSIYDRFTVNQANTKLITFADPSAALKNIITGNNLFFRLNNGTRFKLFAPRVFQGGSSYSHLDELTFPAGNVNSLMTPAIGPRETILNPGPATIQIFRAMGWS